MYSYVTIDNLPSNFSAMTVCNDGVTVFFGRADGVINIGKFSDDLFEFIDEISDVHRSEIKCIKALDRGPYMATGSKMDNFVAIFNTETMQ